jgi:hypothetical protein
VDFNGTITVKENPITSWETYSHTFEESIDEKSPGYFGLRFSQRAEGGYYRASFSIRGPLDFLSKFMENALGREIKVFDNEGSVVWEGYIHQLEYNADRVVYKVDLGDMANAVWVRYRVRGASTTSRSAVQTNANSIAKYGRKEFVLSGGEIESTDIADSIAQEYLDWHGWPSPTPARIDQNKELAEYPRIRIMCRGWFETLNWCTYNQTSSTDNQGASTQINDIITDTDVGQFVLATEVDANSTLISKEYDADRRGGDIMKDIARVGDANNKRWLAYMGKNRTFYFETAAPPEEPT